MAVNPRNWILATPEIGDAATITASHALTECPVMNLQKIQPTDVWASSNLTPYLTIDHGSPTSLNLAMLLFANAQAGDSFRIRRAPTSGELTSNPLVDTKRALRLAGAAQVEQSSATFGAASTTWTLEIRFLVWSRSSSGCVYRVPGSGPGHVGFGVYGNELLLESSAFSYVSVGAIQLGRPYTASLVVTPTERRIYLDGALVLTEPHSLSFPYEKLRVSDQSASAAFDAGWMRLWSTARTDSEISDNYATQLTSGTGLIANYTFEDSLANSGTVGGSMTPTGGISYTNALPLWASGNLDLYDRTHGMYWGDLGHHRWTRIDFDWTANTEAILKLGRLYLANAHQFERNPEYGADIWSFEDGARHETMHGGQRIISPSTAVPGFRLPFSFDSAEEMAVFYDVVRTRGASKDVAIILDPIDHDGRRHQRIGYGTLSQRVTANVPAYEIYRSQIELRGLI